MLREWFHFVTKSAAPNRWRYGHRHAFCGRVERLESRMVLSASIGAYSSPFDITHFAADLTSTSSEASIGIQTSSSIGRGFDDGPQNSHFRGPSPLSASGEPGSFGRPAPPGPNGSFDGYSGSIAHRPQSYTVIYILGLPAPSVDNTFSEQLSQPEVSPPAGFSREPQLAKAGSAVSPESPLPQTSLAVPSTAHPNTSIAPTNTTAIRAPTIAASAAVAPIISVSSSSTVQSIGLSEAATWNSTFQQISDAELLLAASNSAHWKVQDNRDEFEVGEIEHPQNGGLIDGDDLALLDDSALSNHALKRQRDAIDQVLTRLHELPTVTLEHFDETVPGNQRKSEKLDPAAADEVFASEIASARTANPAQEEGGMVWQRSHEDPTGIDYLTPGISQIDFAELLEGVSEERPSHGFRPAFDVAGPTEEGESVVAPVDPSGPADSGGQVSKEVQSRPTGKTAAWFGLATLFGATTRSAITERQARWSMDKCSRFR